MMKEYVPLPEWEECSRAVHAGDPTMIERFIFDHQPSDAVRAAFFRAGLEALIESVRPAAPEMPVVPPALTQVPTASELVVQLEWIRVAVYCKLSGDTRNAVAARRRRRQWVNGHHCQVGPDGNLWVNVAAVNAWVSGADGSSEVHPSLRSARINATR